jgi:hypothetical protein
VPRQADIKNFMGQFVDNIALARQDVGHAKSRSKNKVIKKELGSDGAANTSEGASSGHAEGLGVGTPAGDKAVPQTQAGKVA